MATKIYLSNGAINVDDGVNDLVVINPRQFDWKIDNLNYSVRDKIDNQSYALGALADVQKEDGSGFATVALITSYLNGLMKGLTDTSLQDSTEPSIIAKFNQVLNSTETVGSVAIGDYQVTLDDVTSVAVGSYLVFFNPTANRFMTATVIGISGLPTFDIDTPFDFAYPAGTFVDVARTNMNVNGSATPVVFGLRGTGAPPGVELTAHITRIIISCICTSGVDLSKFANFAKLLRGIVCRKRDGTYENIFNIKSNREMAGIMYDWTSYSASNPQQGVDGFTARITFAGANKIGVVKELKIGEDLEILIQDDLATAQSTETITELEMIAEGHIAIS
jgi:hypothetical protein